MYADVTCTAICLPLLVGPQASGRSLGDYLQAAIFTPAGLNNTFYTSASSTGILENVVDNSGYLSLFKASAGGWRGAGEVARLAEEVGRSVAGGLGVEAAGMQVAALTRS